jgi:hypothetical protein
MRKIFYTILSIFSKNIQKKILHFLKITFSKKYKWSINTYWIFGQENRRKTFLSAARFMHINRPIEGYYFEFGCNEANTFRMAFNNFKYLFNFTYVAFDSFKGLPKVEGADKMEVFYKGKLAFSRKEFERLCKKEGLTEDKLIIVEGFYQDSLNNDLVIKLQPKKAAVIYIDCDLYTSTVSVLNFIIHFLQPGTIIIFDDWNCFYGDPDRGQKKAFNEFKFKYPTLVFEDFVSDAESKSFIFIKDGK